MYHHRLSHLPASSLHNVWHNTFAYHAKAMSTTMPAILKALHDTPLPFLPPALPRSHAAQYVFSHISTTSPLPPPLPPEFAFALPAPHPPPAVSTRTVTSVGNQKAKSIHEPPRKTGFQGAPAMRLSFATAAHISIQLTPASASARAGGGW